MDKYEFVDGVLRFWRKGRRFEMFFLKDDVLTLREVDKRPIRLYEERTPAPGGRLVLSDGADIFERKDVSVQIKEDGYLRIYYKGLMALDEVAPGEGRGDFPAETSLAYLSSRPIYGLGDKPGPLDKRGYEFINWCTDNPYPHTDTDRSLYKAIPFFVMFSPACSVGLFIHNTSKMRFDFNKANPDQVRVDISQGPSELFIFLGSFQSVTCNYALLVGVGMLPRWSLGPQQSRWSYADQASVEAVVRGYKEADIPLSAIYLDIDYMDSFKDFTVSEERFPNIESFCASLREQGVRVIPIIDAGVKAEEGYAVYDNLMKIDGFCKENGEVYHNEVWPGDSVFPAFIRSDVREFWSKEVRRFVELGFAGIWNDMNEPASFKGPLPDDVEMGGLPHSLAHNIYGHKMSEATRDAWLPVDRPFILTRAAYAGTEKYAATWTGDNQSTYEHVRLCLPQLSSMAISGYSLVGVDIGGFNGDTTGELLVRFATVNLFTPIFRNHSACNTKPQEPYAFDEATKRRYRNIVLTRLEILPYLYNCLIDHHELGEPVIRPLIYNFPADPELENENTTIMLGDALLLAPALFPGQTKREVYFPDTFYGYFSHRRYEKGYHIIDCGLDDIPLYVRAGRLVPIAPKGTKTTDYTKTLRLLWSGGPATLIYMEDSPSDSLAFYSRRITRYSVDENGNLESEVLDEGTDSFDLLLEEDDPVSSSHQNVILEPLFEQDID